MAKKRSAGQKKVAKIPRELANEVYQRIPLPYLALNSASSIADVNNSWLENFGYLYKEVFDKPFTDFLTEEYRELFEENFSFFVEAGGFVGDEFEIIDKNGNTRRVIIDGIVDYDEKGNFIQTRCFFRDITMEFGADMELHRLAARNSALLGAVPEIIMEVDNDKNYTWSNQAGLDFFGEDVLSKNAADFFVGEQDIDKQVERVFKGSDNPVYVESWQRRKDGQARLLAWWCKTLKDEHGDVKGALSSARDITDSFQKEERIKHLNAMLAGIRNVSRLINKEKDPEKLLEGVCENLAGQMGYISAWGALLDPGETSAVYITHTGLGKKAFSVLQKKLKNGELPQCIRRNPGDETLSKVNQYHNCADCPLREWHEKYDSILSGLITAPIHVKGRVFAILAVSVPLRYVGDEEVISLFREVARDLALAFQKIEINTELQYLRKEQLKIGKLESLGVMAGGIAHDFNNLLVGILGNIALAKLALPEDERIGEFLDSAEIASRRARDLTQQLLTFAKGGSPVKGEVEVIPLLKESVKFLLRDSKIKSRFSLSKDLHKVSGDESQLTQVINNLVINACEAMPKGGTLKISAENVLLTGEDMDLRVEANQLVPLEGEFVKIRITDTGTGISESIIDKIFDPYFTTKTSGSGLGLSSVFSIIKSHDGGISVKSKVLKGTTFTVLLPAVAVSCKKMSARTAKDAKLLEQTNILIMDDEVLVLNVLSSFLRSFKCRTQVAKHGEEAIRFYKKAMSKDPFDIVILDLSIPEKMGGIETAEKLLKIDSKAKLIVSSGYSDDDAIANYRKYGFTATLRKPYTVEELKNTLKKVLKG